MLPNSPIFTEASELIVIIDPVFDSPFNPPDSTFNYYPSIFRAFEH